MASDLELTTALTTISEAGAGNWSALLDALLRGISHALSNRVSGLMALTGLDPADQDDEMRALIPKELGRLRDLNSLIKCIPVDRSPTLAAQDIREVIRDAVGLMALHPIGRELQWSVAESGDAQPVLAERWVLLRLVLLLADAARSDAAATGATGVCLRVIGADGVTILRTELSGGETPSLSLDSWSGDEYATMLLQRAFAEPSLNEAGCELRFPTLAVSRAAGR